MNKIIASNDNSKITDFEKQKDQLSDVKYKNVKEFCDSLGDDSVSDLKNFVSWVENKFGNEKVELSDGRKYSVWYYLLIYKHNFLQVTFKGSDYDFPWRLLKENFEPTGWLTVCVIVSALFSVVIIGIPFFIISGQELMARNLRNEYRSICMCVYSHRILGVNQYPDDFFKYYNGSTNLKEVILRRNCEIL